MEHNQYRTFQGLTCLMQISTRTEDFIVDTLKLHSSIGPYLREVFKDLSNRKVSGTWLIFLSIHHICFIFLTLFMVNWVMHGADNDVMWLQRDFGIYICNLFDTHQVCLKWTNYSFNIKLFPILFMKATNCISLFSNLKNLIKRCTWFLITIIYIPWSHSYVFNLLL